MQAQRGCVNARRAVATARTAPVRAGLAGGMGGNSLCTSIDRCFAIGRDGAKQIRCLVPMLALEMIRGVATAGQVWLSAAARHPISSSAPGHKQHKSPSPESPGSGWIFERFQTHPNLTRLTVMRRRPDRRVAPGQGFLATSVGPGCATGVASLRQGTCPSACLWRRCAPRMLASWRAQEARAGVFTLRPALGARTRRGVQRRPAPFVWDWRLLTVPSARRWRGLCATVPPLTSR